MAALKEYGLIKRGPKKNSNVIHARPSIFDDDDDDSSEDGRKGVGKSLQREADRINAKKQVKLNLQSALAEDPTVFEYDAVYDDMVQKKNEEIGVQKATKVKKSRYIESLMKAAQSRKLDTERATERKVQKERLAEGHMFADKEKFVTLSFKKKLQELKEQEEKEKRQAQIDALTDVTKQADLSGFYRQIYRQTLGPKNNPEIKVEAVKSASVEEETILSGGETAAAPTTTEAEQNPSSSGRKPRQFRKHIRDDTSSSSSEDEKSVEIERRRHKKDSGKHKKRTEQASTSEDDDDDDDGQPKNLRQVKDSSLKAGEEEFGPQRSTKKHLAVPAKKRRTTSDKDSEDGKPDEDSILTSEGLEENKTRKKQISDEVDGEKPSKEELVIRAREKRRALFTKRNVGEVFEAARTRFIERRDSRNATLVQ